MSIHVNACWCTLILFCRLFFFYHRLEVHEGTYDTHLKIVAIAILIHVPLGRLSNGEQKKGLAHRWFGSETTEKSGQRLLATPTHSKAVYLQSQPAGPVKLDTQVHPGPGRLQVPFCQNLSEYLPMLKICIPSLKICVLWFSYSCRLWSRWITVSSMGTKPKNPLRRSRRQEFAFAVPRSEQDHLREGLWLGRGGRGSRGRWKMLVEATEHVETKTWWFQTWGFKPETCGKHMETWLLIFWIANMFWNGAKENVPTLMDEKLRIAPLRWNRPRIFLNKSQYKSHVLESSIFLNKIPHIINQHKSSDIVW